MFSLIIVFSKRCFVIGLPLFFHVLSLVCLYFFHHTHIRIFSDSLDALNVLESFLA